MAKLNAPTELDPYAVLGVERDADGSHIQRQYKRLAKLFHPDLNPDPVAAARMKALNEAYYVLGDARRRQAYDRLSDPWARWATEPASADGLDQALRRFEGDLDDELSLQEMLSRRRASCELGVRKTDYRLYHVSSIDQSAWFRVSVDTGCHCPDANGPAGPFGCKHWYAMEAFRNNGDRPLETSARR
ncbi:MAG: J domain-containing protein [Chloroflexota bacterium]